MNLAPIYCSRSLGVTASVMTGTSIDGATLHVTRAWETDSEQLARHHCFLGEYKGRWRFSTPTADDGRQFASRDAAHDYAVEHGYLTPYWRRDWCRTHRCLHTWLDTPTPALNEHNLCHRSLGEQWDAAAQERCRIKRVRQRAAWVAAHDADMVDRNRPRTAA